MNLSIIAANLPAMKRFLYELQTGQSGARLTDRQFEMEASMSWGGSKGGKSRTYASKGSSSKHDRSYRQSKQMSNQEEVQDEGGSETGILRVVDVTVELEDKHNS